MNKKPLAGLLPLLILVFLSPPRVFAASLPDNLVGQKVFVKYNLIFPGPAPKVYADEIVFIEDQQDCKATIWEFVIGKGAEVEIVKMAKEGDFLCLAIAAGEFGNRDIFLAKSKNGDFDAAFNRAFSFNEVDDTPVESCDPKTEEELIKCLGFPIYECRQEDVTIFYYNLGFVGCRVNSFHDIWFKLKDGKVLENWGNI